MIQLHMSLLKFFLKNIKKQKNTFIFFVITNILVTMVEPYFMPVITSKFIDAMYCNNNITIWIVFYIIAFLSFVVFFLIEYFFFTALLPKLEIHVRSELLDHIYHLPVTVFEKKSEGEIARSICMISDNIKLIADKLFSRVIPMLIVTVAIVIKFFMINFYMGLILSGWILSHMLIVFINYKNIQQQNKIEAKFHLKTNGFVLDSLKNIFIIEIKYLIKFIKKKLNLLQKNEQEAHINSQKALTFSKLLQCLSIFIIQGLIANGVIIYLYRKNFITREEFVLLFGLIGSVINIVWRMIDRIPELFQAIAKCKPAIALLNYEIQQEYNNIIKNQKGNLTVKNISIALNDQDIIKNLSFNLESGDKLAIIGESGCGKTTLLNVIYGLLKQNSGEVFMDNQNPLLLNKEFKSQYCNYITTKKVLFFDSIKNNFFCDNEEKIRYLMDLTCLTDFVNNLDQKLDTIIDNNATSISEGQCQRINICRSIINYDKSSILFMDEPLNGLDDKTAKIILNNIIKLYNNKTIICIDHSLKFINYANKIVFFSGQGIIFDSKENMMTNPIFVKYLNHH